MVAQHDGTRGALTGDAQPSNVLSELRVGKGQYLGLLPTLIIFSLASLGSFLVTGAKNKPLLTAPENSLDDAIAFEVGLAFVEATILLHYPELSNLSTHWSSLIPCRP